MMVSDIVPNPVRTALPPYRPLRDAEASSYPRHAVSVPPGILRAGRYLVRFANCLEDLEAVQRLRFCVFNLELNERRSRSYLTGLDRDAFDERSHHLMVLDAESNAVVGTCRLMTAELAQHEELHSRTVFDLSTMPDRVLRHGVEVGRACVDMAHRNGRVVPLLWRGIARYLDWNDKRYVFGCCSVPARGAAELASLSLSLARDSRFHDRISVAVRPDLSSMSVEKVLVDESTPLPPLFASYLRLGAKVCGGPAHDREFGVASYLVLLDLRDVEPTALASLCASGLWHARSATLRIE